MSTLDYQGGEVLAALESQFVPKLVAKPKPEIKIKNAIVCSFYTSDDYYKSHGVRLRENLEELGIEETFVRLLKKRAKTGRQFVARKLDSSLKFVRLIQIRKYFGSTLIVNYLVFLILF
jgi:hypothetical protein